MPPAGAAAESAARPRAARRGSGEGEGRGPARAGGGAERRSRKRGGGPGRTRVPGARSPRCAGRPLPPGGSGRAAGLAPAHTAPSRPAPGLAAFHACARAIPARSFFPLPPRQSPRTNDRRPGTGTLPIAASVGGAGGGRRGKRKRARRRQ